MRAILLTCTLCLYWIVAVAGSAKAQDLPPGNDCWETETPDTTVHLPELPADFFGIGSDLRPAEDIAV